MMETLLYQPQSTSDNSVYGKKVCTPQCGLLLDYPSNSDLVYTVDSLDYLDQNVKTAIIENLEPGEDICQIIVSPFQGVLSGSETKHPERTEPRMDPWKYDWVFVLQQQHMLLLDIDHATHQPKVSKAPLKALLSIEWGRILLQSWIAWSWVEENHIEHAAVNFNVSGATPLEETIVYLYQSNYALTRKPLLLVNGMDEIFESFPLKFVERIPLLLTQQERIMAAEYHAFQPPTWRSWHGLFKKVERKAIPASALIMTNRQLIIMREEEHDSGMGLGTIIQTVKLKDIKNIFIDNTSEGSQFIIVIGNEHAEERLFVETPEECYQDIYESFRSYLTSRSHF